MDGQPVNENARVENCKHEFCFKYEKDSQSKIVVCLDCALVRIEAAGAQVEGRIKNIEPVIWAVGEIARQFIRPEKTG